ncbi:DUF4179 domain-containing protein [Solibacillus sp. MA9]|uniref:DUF4179 domain-containing protein n=1 Tax=Solibacillus palustris TaxID=2908203 RepID=A0ABS9UHT7_9BACL|nr:DUF4179 domain-containing protein [Solibacillus sp. MA9]MCH7323913.1 DUF4179 domain-containing protein [Solibacillus sp. MA9]
MERFEKKIKNEMKNSDNLSYPDFDQMWNDIQQDELKTNGGKPVVIVPRRRKRFALVAGLTVALLATPVYGALTYDWSNILSYREGIQTALEQGFGQTIEQSITKNDVTLTVHTAYIDDNRTFLLYSLKPNASWSGKDINFEQVGLKDQNGKLIEGNYGHQWNNELGVFQGYFETDWIVKGQAANVEFVMENIQFIGVANKPIDYNPNNSDTQVFQIQQDGIDSVTVQAFEQPGEKTLLRSSVTFTDTKMASESWARIEVIDDMNQPIKKAETSTFGTPGATGQYLSQQVFKTDSLRAENTKFQLTYNHTLETTNGIWNLNLNLEKKQLKNASFKEVLNIPLVDDPMERKIREMTVTPTQVRLIIEGRGKYYTFPYTDYQLDIGGTLLTGYMPGKRLGPNEMELHFEITGIDAMSLAKQPMTFIAKHRINEAEGDNNPIRLTDISAEPQSLTTHIAGYPISWTYYMKDNNLYVESLSSDTIFGGVVQTYYLDGKERHYGMPAIQGIFGSENNKRMDVYENFDKTELDIFISNYGTHDHDDILRVPLKAGK